MQLIFNSKFFQLISLGLSNIYAHDEIRSLLFYCVSIRVVEIRLEAGENNAAFQTEQAVLKGIVLIAFVFF